MLAHMPLAPAAASLLRGAASVSSVATGVVQPTLESLGTPLREVTFVVVDLETTGQAPGAAAITEIGAVKVRGGEVLGEFQTLVNPGVPIPPMITVLTGITTAMVLPAPGSTRRSRGSSSSPAWTAAPSWSPTTRDSTSPS
jgi:DNA polymerase III, alpha subunit (gram-positive type)